jgi:chemotaxis protein histidine kinase CheA
MTEHYGCAVLPARPGRPRDKAKVETGVLIAQRWILAVLHQRTVYSLRGKVLPVVDLRRRFGLPVGTTGKETRIVVVEVNGATVGMIVDDGVSEVLQVSDEVVEPPNPIVMTD